MQRRAAVEFDSASFPRIAGPDDEPDLAPGEDPLWDILISMKSGKWTASIERSSFRTYMTGLRSLSLPATRCHCWHYCS